MQERPGRAAAAANRASAGQVAGEALDAGQVAGEALDAGQVAGDALGSGQVAGEALARGRYTSWGSRWREGEAAAISRKPQAPQLPREPAALHALA